MAIRGEYDAIIGWPPVGGTIEFDKRASDAFTREF
jgi:hypothetical protein